jgi:outer membrane protein insertion porin family
MILRRKITLFCYFFRLNRSLFLFLTVSFLAFIVVPQTLAQMMPGQPSSFKKPEKTKSRLDPIVSRAQPISKLDTETDAALKRANQPGVILADTQKSGYIYRIQVIGAKKVEPDAVFLQLKTHINSVFDRQDIQQDIKNIFAMGLFSDVQVEKRIGANESIELTYRLQEKPTIYQIRFKNNDFLSEEDLNEVIDLKAYHVVDQSRIKENLVKIKKAYADKGYFLSDIQVEIAPTKKEDLKAKSSDSTLKSKITVKISDSRVLAPDFVDVTFNIDEGSKVRIQNISFLGNSKISSDEIKSHMRSKENHLLSLLTQWGVYNEEMLDVDLLLIEQLYQEQGFLNVQVQRARVHLSADKKNLSIQIPIKEGDSYQIGELDIVGDFIVMTKKSNEEISEHPIFFRGDLRKRITLQKGDVFNRTLLMQELLSIAELYRNEGYAYVNIVPETAIHENELKVDVKLHVDAGPKVFYERIDIVGNSITIDDVIRRELRVYEGEQTSSSMMRLSEMRVNQLGYFESVKFKTKPGSQPDKMVIEIEVKEKRTGSVQVGGGYGSGGEGWRFEGQISQNNLFGRGQSLTASVQWSSFRRMFDLRFIDPYLFYLGNAPITFSTSLYNMQRSLGDYSRDATGGDVTLGYPVGHFLKGTTASLLKEANQKYEFYVPDFDNFRLFLSYSLERVETGDNAVDVWLFGLHSKQPRYTSAIRPILQFDQRNNRLFPSGGYFLELRSEWATSYFGSGLLAQTENHWKNVDGIKAGLGYLKPEAESNRFVRYGANTRFYYNFDEWFFLKSWVLKLNVDLGLLHVFETPIVAENYRLGGMGFGNSSGLRGYFFQSVGPALNTTRKYQNQSDHQFVVGGNKQFLLNLELEFPVVKSLNISGVFFFDMGNVFGRDENLFYVGGKNSDRYTDYFDPLKIFSSLGLYSSVGFGVRWFSPFGPLRFEWGFPLVRRPIGTPGIPQGDGLVQFEFNIGTSF